MVFRAKRPQRLLLCRPAGGLNDMLCQVERCCRYAERFDRTVIVETDHQTATEFRDAFSNYFVSHDRRLILSAERFRGQFDAVSVFPEPLRRRVTAYSSHNGGREARTVEDASGVRISFDFDRDYPHALIVHHDFGGGRHSIDALGRMLLAPALVRELTRRLALLPRPYAALHIRNTDYKADYRHRLTSLADEIAGAVFIATDNRASLEDCRTAFGAGRVYSFADLSEADGRPLYQLSPTDPARRRNTDAVLDLIMLGLADRYETFELTPNWVGTLVSGYTSLALDLRASPNVLESIAPRATSAAASRTWLHRLSRLALRR